MTIMMQARDGILQNEGKQQILKYENPAPKATFINHSVGILIHAFFCYYYYQLDAVQAGN